MRAALSLFIISIFGLSLPGNAAPVSPRSIKPAQKEVAALTPWWDDFPTLVQTGDVSLAARTHATGSLIGAADDPCWGLFAQRQRMVSNSKQISDLHSKGIKALAWFEGFGTAEAYIAQLKRKADGTWEKETSDPLLTRLYRNHWGWQEYDETGVVRWVGLHDYYNDADYARPYTRMNSSYGAPLARYPDGRPAIGYNGSSDDPRNSLVYDAACSKDILGKVTIDYDFNSAVNSIVPGASAPHGSLTGLLRVVNPSIGVPDPGYTPETWARLKKHTYAGIISMGKDSACPIWIEYARASVRQALDAGIDGLWVDNYSPWDSFGGQPNQKAFGEWSIFGFRSYLDKNYSLKALHSMGVSNAKTFDVRKYMKDRCRIWGGNPDNLSDPEWSDTRWQDDPIWRAYLIYKRQAGTAALTAYYRTVKQESSKSGKPDFLVSGNDIPGFSLGWARGNLDMVSTELTWGWWLTTGPRGFMPPPLGSYVPLYKLAREHAKSRFVNAWMYAPDNEKDKPGIANVLYYQGLANHAFPMPLYPHGTVGNEATDAAFYGFVRKSAQEFGQRMPIEEIGLYYSSSSQLMEMLPGGFKDHSNQPHSFSFYGWGTALTQTHTLWRAVPEWKLTSGTLRSLRMIIIPNAGVFPAEDVPILERWVLEGGSLIISGHCGQRFGEKGSFALASGKGTLKRLIRSNSTTHAFGKGKITCLPADPGIPFYLADTRRPEMLTSFTQILHTAWPSESYPTIDAPDVPWDAGITLYHTQDRLFVDINNTRIDLTSDAIKPLEPFSFTLRLPPNLRGKRVRARTRTPGNTSSVHLTLLPNGDARVTLGIVPLYVSIIIEKE